MTGARDDDLQVEEADPPTPWHNSTPAVLAASAAGLAAIALVVLAVTFIAGRFNEPEQAPLNFVDPTFLQSSSAPDATPTTTETITSTSPPVTTDINPPTDLTPSAEPEPSTTQRRPRSNDDEDDAETTKRRPRFNETRTLNPIPAN